MQGIVWTSIGWGMLALGGFGLLTSTVFLGIVLMGAARFRSEAKRQNELLLLLQPEFLPAVSLFKPLHGMEAGLEGNLRGFYEQDYLRHAVANGYAASVNGISRVEVLFCARDEADAGLAVARRLAAEYPEVTTRFCTSGEPWAANAKVCSLVTMAKVATHDVWVISDSDVRVGPEYLRRVVLPFADEAVGCATCLYRGMTAEGGIWSRLEAVGMTVEMSSGVCAANLMEPMQFALGPTMVARRESVDAIGGFEATVEYCADDFVLGNWISAKGYKVVLSGHVDRPHGVACGVCGLDQAPGAVDEEYAFFAAEGALWDGAYVWGAVWGAGVGWGFVVGDAGAGVESAGGECAGAESAGLGGE